METALIKSVEKIYRCGKGMGMNFSQDVLGDVCLIQRRLDLNYNMAIIFSVALGLQIDEARCSPQAILTYLGFDKWESLALFEDFLEIFKRATLIDVDFSTMMGQAFTVNRDAIRILCNPNEYIEI